MTDQDYGIAPVLQFMPEHSVPASPSSDPDIQELQRVLDDQGRELDAMSDSIDRALGRLADIAHDPLSVPLHEVA